MKNRTLMYRLCLIAIGLAALLTLNSCDDDEVQPVAVQVTVRYPSNYLQSAGAGISVTLRNTATLQDETIATNEQGIANFPAVFPGTYDVSASQTFTAQQAQTVTGLFSRPMTISAAKAGQLINSMTNLFIELELAGAPAGDLVIKEVYYTGSKTPSGGNYFSDQFIEIFNNSDQVIFLDGLCIGDVWGVSGQINPSSQPTDFKDDAGHVYLNSVWRIPGTGNQHPLQPGSSIVIAQDGIDHKTDPNGNANSPVNLGTANWETFNERPDNRDTDAPGVPNLERLYFTGGFDWLLTVFGPGIVIFRTNNFDGLERVTVPSSPTLQPRIKAPNSLVLDAFEALRDADSGTFKRVPVGLDAGFVFAADTYTGESFRRKTATTLDNRRVLQDLNNSSQDFEKLAVPTPKGFGN